jgi:hypothetical protein
MILSRLISIARWVGGLPLTSGGFGGVQEFPGQFGLLLVDGQELGGGLEVRAGQTAIGVRELRWPAAVAVGKGRRRGRVGV